MSLLKKGHCKNYCKNGKRKDPRLQDADLASSLLYVYWHNLLNFTPCNKTYIETESPIQPLCRLKMQAQYPSDIQWQLPYTQGHQLQYGNDGSSLSNIAAFVQRGKALPLLQIWTWASSSLHLWLTFCCTVSNTWSINVLVCVFVDFTNANKYRHINRKSSCIKVGKNNAPCNLPTCLFTFIWDLEGFSLCEYNIIVSIPLTEVINCKISFFNKGTSI